jgi:FemAB-related protein (PEP-CTERM system-associated)
VSNTIVSELDAGEEGAWDRFVEQRKDATFFHRAGWRSVLQTSLRHQTFYRVARRGREIVGILPLVHVRSPLFGASLVSVAFCVYGGIVADDSEAMQALADDAALLGKRLAVSHVELRHRLPMSVGWVEKSNIYATFRRVLATDDESNLKAVPRKKRADIRKSLGNGLCVDLSGDLDSFYRLYAQSLHNLGTPVWSKRFFQAIQTTFPTETEVSVVHGPEGPVAGLMAFYFKDQVLPYYGGALPAGRPLHAYDHMYWTLMCRAVARDAILFDFGRSKQGTGSFEYKTFWGFEPEPLHYQFHLVRGRTLPDINPLNPKYKLMIETWKRLPLAIANAIGPHVARQLG